MKRFFRWARDHVFSSVFRTVCAGIIVGGPLGFLAQSYQTVQEYRQHLRPVWSKTAKKTVSLIVYPGTRSYLYPSHEYLVEVYRSGDYYYARYDPPLRLDRRKQPLHLRAASPVEVELWQEVYPHRQPELRAWNQ